MIALSVKCHYILLKRENTKNEYQMQPVKENGNRTTTIFAPPWPLGRCDLPRISALAGWIIIFETRTTIANCTIRHDT